MENGKKPKEDGKNFRSSMFGGFNKQDVMDYIEQLQNELAEVKNQVSELEKENSEALKQLEKIPALQEELEKKQAVEEQNSKLNAEVEQLRAQTKKAADEYEKIKVAEAQLGAAFVDARRFSDEIVEAAKGRAADVSKQASDDISLKAEQIRQVASDAEKLSAEMRQKMDNLTRSIADLSGKMSAVAVTLVKTEAPTDFKPRVDFEVLKDLGFENTDDVRAVEVDEETGLTFVSYEPNTRFNNDLDFKPEKFDADNNETDAAEGF